MAKVFPSLMAADIMNLRRELEILNPHCEGYHIDIMDNHFVPNLTFGPSIVNAISNATNKQLWVHLMVDNPEKWCDTLKLPAQTIFSFHFESTKDIDGIIKRIKENNWQPSIAIKPKTDISELFPILHMINQVLIMSVEPGFSGQRFLPSAIDSLKELVAHRDQKQLPFVIGMDGGISVENIGTLAQEGVEDFAIASAIFDQPDPIAALQKLR